MKERIARFSEANDDIEHAAQEGSCEVESTFDLGAGGLLRFPPSFGNSQNGCVNGSW